MRRPLVVGALMLAMFLSAMEVSIVATAMPSIVSILGGFSEFTWVFSLFLLTQTATIPIYGKLADLYGRRPVFAVGTGIFLLGSLLCGTAGTMTQLIAFRAIQGIGAGAVQPIASTIIGDIFTLRERARMQGLLSSVWAVASIVGPLMGGFIVEHLHWAWIFWLNLPFGILAIAGVWLFLREPLTHRKHAIDYLGAVLLMVGVTLVLLELVQGGTAWDWTSPQSIGLLVGSALVLALFVFRETRAPEPMLPLDLFTNRVVATADAGTVLVGGLLLSITSFIPLFVQGTMGLSPTAAGFILASMSLGWPTASAVAGRVMLAIGFRATALLGGALTVVAGMVLAFAPHDNGPFWVVVSLAVIGAGLGFVSTTLIVAIQSSVDWGLRGVATASNMFARQLGSSLWVALLGSLLNGVLLARLLAMPASTQSAVGELGVGFTSLLLDSESRASLDPAVLSQLESALADAMHVVFLGILVTTIAGVVLAVLLPGGRPREASGPGEPPAEAAYHGGAPTTSQRESRSKWKSSMRRSTR
jgi:EmrB/QacA subfamily drug resistance transporter